MRAFTPIAALLAAATPYNVSAWWFGQSEICHLPLDTMFLQDTTGSFMEDLPLVVKQLAPMVEQITATFPDSRFGVAEFKDKHYEPWGEPSDFCYKLGFGELTSDFAAFIYAYSVLYASGGMDGPEAQFHALINTAYDAAVKWRPLAAPGATAKAGEAGARVIIMSTDALPHMAGDIDKYSEMDYPKLPRDLPVSSGISGAADIDKQCFQEDYPSPDQVKEALTAAKIHLVILTPDDDPTVLAGWRWVNSVLLGQPDDFLQVIKNDSSDLLEGALNALKKVTETACDQIVEPTTAPTTPPTTVATTSAPVQSTTTTRYLRTSTLGATGATIPSDCPPESPCNEGVIIKIAGNVKDAEVHIKA